MKNIATLLTASLLLGACTVQPKEAYFDRANPAGLLDISSEIVSVKLDSDGAIGQLTQWVNQDQPSRAELACAGGGSVCTKARKVLQQFGVPVVDVASGENAVTLVYERVLARDCENRFIDNTINPYNFNHPTYGCSIASNTVQMISDKQQLVNPALLDNPEAEKSAQVYKAYMAPSTYKHGESNAEFRSILGENIGGGGGNR